MTVIKSKATINYTIIPNEALQDKLINFDSRGLLSYMLSLPENWEFRIANLMKESPNAGRDKIQRMIKELEEAGYITRKMKRSSNGSFSGVFWIISPNRDHQKTSKSIKKTRQTAKAVTADPFDITKYIYINSSSINTREDFLTNSDIEKTKEENNSFFNSVKQEIQVQLKKNCEKINGNIKWYIDMKIEEYINRYPGNKSKADCCMYIIQAVDNMTQKRRLVCK